MAMFIGAQAELGLAESTLPHRLVAIIVDEIVKRLVEQLDV